MEILDSENTLLMMRRYSPADDNSLLCVFNLSERKVEATLPEKRKYRDIIEQKLIDGAQPVALPPWHYLWLKG